MTRKSAIILAAGKGTRMKSDLLKVAHEIAGKPIVHYVIEAVNAIPVDHVYIVVGHQSEHLKSITSYPNVTFVLQEEQLGTGHAVAQAARYFKGKPAEKVFVLAGDCPLLRPQTLQNLEAVQTESNAEGAILTTKMKDPASYGRILRGKMGTVQAIREAKDCTPDELLIDEINTGAYCFNSPALFDALEEVKPNNTQGEFYLTDVIHILKRKGKVIAGYCSDNPDEAIGINTRMDMAAINQIIYSRNNQQFMQNGATIVDPSTTYIDSTVKIGTDTVIHPFTSITGDSVIGEKCQIGPNTVIQDSQVTDHTKVLPFKHLHP